MDGVLIDSEPLWRAAEIEVFGDVGLALSEADCLETQGLRIDEVVAYWHARRGLGEVDHADLAGRIVDRVAELVRKRGEPMPGVLEAVEACRARGLRIGLASSSSERLIETVLGHFDLRGHFEAARSADREAFGKPHPAVYLGVAAEMGVDPVRCLAVEDSFNGLLSALAASMRCVAIPDAAHREDPRFDVAHWRLASLERLGDPLDAFMAGFEDPDPSR